MAKKQKLKFKLVAVFDPKTGQKVNKLVPVSDVDKLNDKAKAILNTIEQTYESMEYEKDEEEPLHPLAFTGMFNRNPDEMTDDEIRKFTCDGLFPNDGYDYSRHMLKSGGGDFIPAYEKGELIPEQKGDVREIDYTNVDFKKMTEKERDMYTIRENKTIQNLEKANAIFDNAEYINTEEDDKDKNQDDNMTLDGFFSELEKEGQTEVDDNEEEEEGVDEAKEAALEQFLAAKREHEALRQEADDAYGTKGSKRRPEKKELNKRFEDVMQQYDMDHIGVMEDDYVPDGELDFDDIEYLYDEFNHGKNRDYRGAQDWNKSDDVISKEMWEKIQQGVPEGMIILDERSSKKFKANEIDHDEMMEINLKRIAHARENGIDDDGMEEEEGFDIIRIKKKRRDFDIESVVSRLSDHENHPTDIEEQRQTRIELSKKTGLPLNVLKEKEKKERIPISALQAKLADATKRKKNESKEEKKRRKKLVKLMNKKRRETKKSIKETYKQEEVRRGKIDALPHMQQKVKVQYV